MPQPGTLKNRTDIKLLILFALQKCEEPIPFGALNDILLANGLVEFFDFTAALDDLMEKRHLRMMPFEGEDCYFLTPLAMDSLTQLIHDLPYSAREKTEKTAKAIMKQRKHDKQIRATFQKQLDGTYNVDLSINDGKSDLFRLSLSVPNEAYVNRFCRTFKHRPTEVYEEVMRVLLRQCEQEEEKSDG